MSSHPLMSRRPFQGRNVSSETVGEEIGDPVTDTLVECNAEWKTVSTKRSAVYGQAHRTGDHAWKRWKFASKDVKELWRQLLLRSISEDVEELLTLLSAAPWKTVCDVHDTDGYRPTHHAAATGKVEVMRVLLENGFAVDGENVPDKHIDIWAEVTEVMTAGITPLHLAARHGHTDVVDLLLSYGASIGRCAVTGHGTLTGKVTAVQLAAGEGHLDLALKFYETGADVEQPGRYGSAVSCGGVAFARMLQKRGCTLQQSTLSLMLMQLANETNRLRGMHIDPLREVRGLLEVMSELRITPSPAVLASLLRDWRLATSDAAEAIRLMVLHGAPLANSSNLLLAAASKGDKKLVGLMLRLGWNAGATIETTRPASCKLLADINLMSRLPAFATSGMNLPQLNELQKILEEAEGHCPTLKQWCRWTILRVLVGPQRVCDLPLSKPMRDYLLLADVKDV